MILDDFQGMYGNLLIGEGTPYDVDWSKSGLRDMPALRTTDTDRVRGDGVWVGEEFAGGQTIPLSVQMFGRAGVDLGEAVRAFDQNTTPRIPRDFWFKFPHQEQAHCLLGARVRRRAVPPSRHMREFVRAELDLFAPDPARYGAETTLAAVAGVRPVVAGTNEGTRPVFTAFRVYGPVSAGESLELVHEQTGSTVSMVFSAGINPRDYLVIDPRTGTALVNGYDDRGADLVAREWWPVAAGESFAVELRGPAGLRVDVTWRPAWW